MLVVDESSFSSKLTILYLKRANIAISINTILRSKLTILYLKLVIGYFATHPEIGSKLTILYLKPLYL